MSEERTMPTPEAILAHLKATGSGTRKLEVVASWIASPVLWDGEKKEWRGVERTPENFLMWAEDLHQMDPQALGEGTLMKIGQQLFGDAYGIRRPGESNSDEISRLRSRVNDLEKQLDILNRGQSQSANRSTFLESRNKSLEEENMALRGQVEMLNRQLSPAPATPPAAQPAPKSAQASRPQRPQPVVRPAQPSRPQAAGGQAEQGGTQEKVGALAEKPTA